MCKYETDCSVIQSHTSALVNRVTKTTYKFTCNTTTPRNLTHVGFYRLCTFGVNFCVDNKDSDI